MDDNTFWEIIDSSRQQAVVQEREPHRDLMDIHEKTLAAALEKLTPDEITGFNERFRHYHRLAYRWDLWGAIYWMEGGCSDDGFIDFRACLISLGKELFYQVLNDADSLADLYGRTDIPFMMAEGFQYVADRVYEAKTGHGMPWDNIAPHPSEPAGAEWDFDDEEEMARRLPKVVAKAEELEEA